MDEEFARVMAENETLRALLCFGDQDALRDRKEGREDLERALAQHGARAEWCLTGPVFLEIEGFAGAELIGPVEHMSGKASRRIIKFAGAPNAAMKPENEAARIIYEAWQRSLSGSLRPPELFNRAVRKLRADDGPHFQEGYDLGRREAQREAQRKRFNAIRHKLMQRFRPIREFVASRLARRRHRRDLALLYGQNSHERGRA